MAAHNGKRKPVQAHSSNVQIRFIERWPKHNDRATDPHTAIFNAAKRRLKKLGEYYCRVDSKLHWGQLEAHHTLVEFAHANDVDIEKFNELWGLHLKTDEEFLTYINSPSGLEILCELHHRGQEGVHSLPEPEWNVLRVAKDDSRPITVLYNSGIPVVKRKG
ncbi:MAG: hypothetical protein ACYDCC_04885 [Actinomycetota bacterium]